MKQFRVNVDFRVTKGIYVDAETAEQAEQIVEQRCKDNPYQYTSNPDYSELDAIVEVNEEEDDPDESDGDPAQDVYAAYSEDIRKAVAYINEQLEPEDKTIICAMVDKNFNRHMNPSYGIDDGKITDLLEEYGDDHDLGEGWWESECELDDIVLLIQFEN